MEDITLTTHKSTPELEKQVGDDTKKTLEKAVREERNSMPYLTASSCNPMGAVVPTKLSYETIEALNEFTQNGIDTAQFLKEKLNYDSRISVCDAFAAEQVDAIALAIKQIEKNKGFIVGDMAGIGKGRIVAGLCRYAKQQNKIPVFITIGATLFSDQFRDIEDIGGYSGSEVPLSDVKKFPLAFMFNEDGVVFKNINGQDILIQKAYKNEITLEYCKRKVMPTDHDVVFLTYSQLNANMENPTNSNAIIKYEFLKAIAPNAIFILDESHTGAGDGNTGKNLYEILSLASGVAFASATYAKVPKSMMLYIPKTDIQDSNIRPKTIVEAVAENGEAIQEYIASLLVKSGQMIRRERTYDNCIIDYKYMNLGDKAKYYKMYDDIMTLYRNIENFTKSNLYADAFNNAIKRYAQENEIKIVKRQDVPTGKAQKSSWESANANSYFVSFSTTNGLNNKFQYIENLLFAIKAKYVANEAIRLMASKEDENGKPYQIEYNINNKKTFVNTNFKPIIAVRNTSESALKDLGYKKGDILTKEQNDYSKTLVKVLENINVGVMLFTPVNKAKQKIKIEEAKIDFSDYSDNGKRFYEILADINKLFVGLPLSPIDEMINTIQATKRQSWDFEYVNARDSYYKVEEITKRGLSIIPREDGNFEVVARKSEPDAKKVSRFNRGESDVVILNTAGSTGISLHSSVKFIDKRPRAMLIHQVELDVNTEVQKRGRIHRTGQVNNPRYAYMVSVIPSEIRKLLMLRRKLRSLDANTTGNVKQSAKASQILDSQGNEIEDMTNKYGYKVLLEFLDLPNKEIFKDLMEEAWYKKTASPDEKFEDYLRKIETLSCELQESFYNEMNVLYTQEKLKLIEEDAWDLETNIDNLQTATENKAILYKGSNKNQFTRSVYAEDKYANPKGVPYTKEEVYEKMEKLAGGTNWQERHELMLEEYDIYVQNEIQELIASYGEPDVSNATTEEEAEKIVQLHNDKVNESVGKAKSKFNKIRSRLQYFVPNKPVNLPIELDALQGGENDEKTGQRRTLLYTVGLFLGYNFNVKSGKKFSPMNIQLMFAAPSKLMPKLNTTLTLQYDSLLNWIEGGRVYPQELAQVREWIIQKTTKRDSIRVLTGEIFKAFEIAETIIDSSPNYQRKKRLIKYTTANNQIETGVKLWLNKWIPLTTGRSIVYAPINSDSFKELVKTSVSKVFWLPSFKEFFIKQNNQITFNICTGFYSVRGRRKSKPDKLYVSELYNDEFINKLKDVLGVTPIIEYFRGIDMFAEGNWKYFWTMEFARFQISEDNFNKLTDFLYNDLKTIVKIDSQDALIVSDVEDVTLGEEETENAGIFEYYPLTKFDTSNVPNNYIKDSFKETSANRYGIIQLSFPATVIEAKLFKIVPANIEEKQAMQLIFSSIFDDETRLKFIEDVKAMGDDYNGITEYTQSVIGVHPKYAVGNVDDYYIGEVISRNIDLEKAESKKVESAKPREVEKIPIDWETIQDYLITLKSL